MDHLQVGKLLLRQSDIDGAAKSIRLAKTLAGQEGWLWGEIGDALNNLALYDEARPVLEQAVHLEPRDPLHLYRLGITMQALGNGAAALRCFLDAVALAPEEAWLQSHLGYALIEADDLDGAQVALSLAEKLKPNDALNRSRLVLLAERRTRRAKKIRRSRLALDSGRDPPITACVILAAPRTGSTVLGQSVSAAWGTNYLGEVFHEQPEGDHTFTNFFHFRRTIFQADSLLSVPTVRHQSDIFSAYCKHLWSASSTGASVLDIKYYSWHHLNPAFVMPEDRPTLVKLVQAARWPVVHLVRENLFALYCSLELARKRGIWHRTSVAESASHQTKLVIDVDACLREMQRLDSARQTFDVWFDDYSEMYRLSYERLFLEESFSNDVSDTFRKVFKEPPEKPLTPVSSKLTPPLRKVVSNIDEVLQGLDGTLFHTMAVEVLV